ncbi:DNA repair protein [Actinidia chinensis var. chinensis]|uniref:DNA repair protein n=1 Tax=Actinidia chinensis var. chinensis TaxID=1590841 RepID=A0A2R6S1B2_ACTCC|nr:DNA repair protein [Actinidia chinensis var. chinensis]
MMEEEEQVEGWIEEEESAKEMLERVLRTRPFLLVPPLHRIPLRLGNVVEVVGPSPSAKTQILIQAAVSCILPKEWNGVNYGGLEHLVIFFDLDCRFDILRLSQSLKRRILEANGLRANPNSDEGDADAFNCNPKKETQVEQDKELFAACMRRFLYVRCYDSSEFLAALKTLHYQHQKQRDTHGVDVDLLMIDSIGAFYWIDRASTSLAVMSNDRKSRSFQSVVESIVQEIRKLLLMHPMLVLATKAASLGDKYSINEAKRNSRKWSSENVLDLRTVKSGPQTLPYREYMPSIWQSFVTHRVLIRASDEDSKHHNCPTYLSEWLLPSLDLQDKFIVTDAGVYTIS